MPPTDVQSPEGSLPLVSDPSSTAALAIDVVSDVICPWCYIARARLARAFGELAGRGIVVDVTWRAYELNPDMPVEGMDRKDYRTRKFGSWERSRERDDHVAREGRVEGLEFAYERVTRTPNTRRAHRLAHRALRVGGPALQDRIVGALFASYFGLGEDVGDPRTLAGIARSCGLDDTGLEAYLRSSEDEDAVVREERLGLDAGVRGVPAVLDGDRVLWSGAVPASDVVSALVAVRERRTRFAPPAGPAPGEPRQLDVDAGASLFRAEH